MKYVTGGFVSEVEAGERLAQVMAASVYAVLCEDECVCLCVRMSVKNI